MKQRRWWLSVGGLAALGILSVWLGAGKDRGAPSGAEAVVARLEAAGWNVRPLGGVAGRRRWMVSRSELGDEPRTCHPARVRTAPEWRGLAMVREDALAVVRDVTDLEDCAWREKTWFVVAAPETLAEVQRALGR